MLRNIQSNILYLGNVVVLLLTLTTLVPGGAPLSPAIMLLSEKGNPHAATQREPIINSVLIISKLKPSEVTCRMKPDYRLQGPARAVPDTVEIKGKDDVSFRGPGATGTLDLHNGMLGNLIEAWLLLHPALQRRNETHRLSFCFVFTVTFVCVI